MLKKMTTDMTTSNIEKKKEVKNEAKENLEKLKIELKTIEN